MKAVCSGEKKRMRHPLRMLCQALRISRSFAQGLSQVSDWYVADSVNSAAAAEGWGTPLSVQ